MLQFIKIFFESIKLAFAEVWDNKLRSGLSLLGITIGIFCIISIFTGVDFLNTSIEKSFNELGQDVIYVQKDPWAMSPDYPWWEYQKRPSIKFENFIALEKNLTTASHVGYMGYYAAEQVKSLKESLSRVSIFGTTYDFKNSISLKIAEGRFFSLAEAQSGANVAIIGGEVAKELFPNRSAVNQIIKIKGRKFKVIGIIKSNDNLINVMAFDDEIMIPNYTAGSMFKLSKNSFQMVAVKAKEGVALDLMKEDIKRVMRSSRKLRPVQKDNFALNRLTMIMDSLSMLNRQLNIVGWALGFLSLLIGGFGVANIMFVSVKERTKYIGIKKAIGAKKWMILAEFLTESIVLCIIGSLIGLFGVYILAFAAKTFADIEFVLTAKNILLGISISVFIGVMAGFIPALQAANMNPVKAIRS